MGTGKGPHTILRATSIIGGASALNVLIGLVRVKTAAILLGPAGIGFIGLLQSVMTTAATVASLGMGNVGTRQVAEAAGKDCADEVAAARRALLWGTLALACLGGVSCVLLREMLAVRLLGSASHSAEVAWLGLGVALTVAAGSQNALLNGLRRIRDLAYLSIGSALLSTVLGLAALQAWGEQGLLAFVLATPLCTFALGQWFVLRLNRETPPSCAPPLSSVARQWKVMLRLGTAFMVSGFISNAGQLAARGFVQRELGAEGLGQFQAAWAISMTYIGFVLGAMGTDYYPRLTTVIDDPSATNRMVNEQAEIALLLAAPLLLLMLGFAPWIIRALYSTEFAPAVNVLRWQMVGDMLKVASWPLGFVILAAGAGRTFIFTELVAATSYLLVIGLALPWLGLAATGVAYVVMYGALLALVHRLAWLRTGFRWTKRVLAYLAIVLALTSLVFAAEALSPIGAAVLSLIAAVTMSAYGLIRISSAFPAAGRVGALAAKIQTLTGALCRNKAPE